LEVGCVAVLLAEQLILLPPFVPLQVHVQGPEPETDEAFPLLHRFADGFAENVFPLAEPQTPFVGFDGIDEAFLTVILIRPEARHPLLSVTTK
jgi:hypothetical protein